MSLISQLLGVSPRRRKKPRSIVAQLLGAPPPREGKWHWRPPKVEPDEKECKRCLATKLQEEFREGHRPGQRRNICKACEVEQMKERRKRARLAS